jgi:putative transposase
VISYGNGSGWLIVNKPVSRQDFGMPNYKRDKTPGGTWFFTVVSYHRRAFLCDAPVRAEIRSAIKRVRKKYPFEINAWVLMPDHFHCVWTLPRGDSNYSLRISLLKRFITHWHKASVAVSDTRSTSRVKHRESTVWQRRFWEHLIKDDNDLRQHLNYIHYNPVKHGYCQNPADWPYSTVHKFIANGIYPKDWCMADNSLSTDHRFNHRNSISE